MIGRNHSCAGNAGLRAVVGLVLAASGVILAPMVARPGVRGSAHDFTATSWSSKGETCVPCHTPHKVKGAQAARWNPPETKAAFTLYSSETMDAKAQQPNPASKACLSCHDGTVAMNSLGAKPGSGEYLRKGPSNLGTDLSNDHPISIRYDAELARKDPGLYDPGQKVVPALDGRTIQDGMLVDDCIECSSCHDVHRNKGEARKSDKLLLIENDGSALCLSCHNK